MGDDVNHVVLSCKGGTFDTRFEPTHSSRAVAVLCRKGVFDTQDPLTQQYATGGCVLSQSNSRNLGDGV